VPERLVSKQSVGTSWSDRSVFSKSWADRTYVV